MKKRAVPCRMSEAEHELIGRGAAATGVSIAEFLRGAGKLAAKQAIAEAAAETARATPLTDAQVQDAIRFRDSIWAAYQGLAQVAIIRQRLQADSIEAEVRGDTARAKAAREWAQLLGPGAHATLGSDGRCIIVLTNGTTRVSAPRSDDDEDEGGPADGPPAPRPAAQQEVAT